MRVSEAAACRGPTVTTDTQVRDKDERTLIKWLSDDDDDDVVESTRVVKR